MTQLENFDEVINILGNPTKRVILERLSHEPSYSLQIAKDMGLSQQLVSSHLNTMEESGLVESQFEESTRGPKRRIYSLSKSLLITIEIAPFLFNSRMLSFNMQPDPDQISKDSSDFLDQLDVIVKKKEGQEKITAFSTLLQEIDAMLDAIESERTELLYIRNLVVRKASGIVNKIEVPNARRILYYILHSHNENIGKISNKLNIREETVRELLKQMRKDRALPLQE